MSLDYLSDEQKRRYGRFAGEPSGEQLARCFYLDAADLNFADSQRSDTNRLGCALQLGTVRFLGTFLPDPTDIPAGAVVFVAEQMQIGDTSCLAPYRDLRTHYLHAAKIKQLYGYRDFDSQPEYFRPVRWLYAKAWIDTERPSELFEPFRG